MTPFIIRKESNSNSSFRPTLFDLLKMISDKKRLKRKKSVDAFKKAPPPEEIEYINNNNNNNNSLSYIKNNVNDKDHQNNKLKKESCNVINKNDSEVIQPFERKIVMQNHPQNINNKNSDSVHSIKMNNKEDYHISKSLNNENKDKINLEKKLIVDDSYDAKLDELRDKKSKNTQFKEILIMSNNPFQKEDRIPIITNKTKNMDNKTDEVQVSSNIPIINNETENNRIVLTNIKKKYHRNKIPTKIKDNNILKDKVILSHITNEKNKTKNNQDYNNSSEKKEFHIRRINHNKNPIKQKYKEEIIQANVNNINNKTVNNNNLTESKKNKSINENKSETCSTILPKKDKITKKLIKETLENKKINESTRHPNENEITSAIEKNKNVIIPMKNKNSTPIKIKVEKNIQTNMSSTIIKKNNSKTSQIDNLNRKDSINNVNNYDQLFDCAVERLNLATKNKNNEINNKEELLNKSDSYVYKNSTMINKREPEIINNNYKKLILRPKGVPPENILKSYHTKNSDTIKTKSLNNENIKNVEIHDNKKIDQTKKNDVAHVNYKKLQESDSLIKKNNTSEKLKMNNKNESYIYKRINKSKTKINNNKKSILRPIGAPPEHILKSYTPKNKPVLNENLKKKSQIKRINYNKIINDLKKQIKELLTKSSLDLSVLNQKEKDIEKFKEQLLTLNKINRKNIEKNKSLKTSILTLSNNYSKNEKTKREIEANNKVIAKTNMLLAKKNILIRNSYDEDLKRYKNKINNINKKMEKLKKSGGNIRRKAWVKNRKSEMENNDSLLLEKAKHDLFSNYHLPNTFAYQFKKINTFQKELDSIIKTHSDYMESNPNSIGIKRLFTQVMIPCDDLSIYFESQKLFSHPSNETQFEQKILNPFLDFFKNSSFDWQSLLNKLKPSFQSLFVYQKHFPFEPILFKTFHDTINNSIFKPISIMIYSNFNKLYSEIKSDYQMIVKDYQFNKSEYLRHKLSKNIKKTLENKSKIDLLGKRLLIKNRELYKYIQDSKILNKLKRIPPIRMGHLKNEAKENKKNANKEIRIIEGLYKEIIESKKKKENFYRNEINDMRMEISELVNVKIDTINDFITQKENITKLASLRKEQMNAIENIQNILTKNTKLKEDKDEKVKSITAYVKYQDEVTKNIDIIEQLGRKTINEIKSLYDINGEKLSLNKDYYDVYEDMYCRYNETMENLKTKLNILYNDKEEYENKLEMATIIEDIDRVTFISDNIDKIQERVMKTKKDIHKIKEQINTMKNDELAESIRKQIPGRESVIVVAMKKKEKLVMQEQALNKQMVDKLKSRVEEIKKRNVALKDEIKYKPVKPIREIPKDENLLILHEENDTKKNENLNTDINNLMNDDEKPPKFNKGDNDISIHTAKDKLTKVSRKMVNDTNTITVDNETEGKVKPLYSRKMVNDTNTITVDNETEEKVKPLYSRKMVNDTNTITLNNNSKINTNKKNKPRKKLSKKVPINNDIILNVSESDIDIDTILHDVDDNINEDNKKINVKGNEKKEKILEL